MLHSIWVHGDVVEAIRNIIIFYVVDLNPMRVSAVDMEEDFWEDVPRLHGLTIGEGCSSHLFLR